MDFTHNIKEEYNKTLSLSEDHKLRSDNASSVQPFIAN